MLSVLKGVANTMTIQRTSAMGDEENPLTTSPPASSPRTNRLGLRRGKLLHLPARRDDDG